MRTERLSLEKGVKRDILKVSRMSAGLEESRYVIEISTPKVPTSRETLRRSALEQTALGAGTQWAECCCVEMKKQGRAVAGGWPGTLSEARTRVTLAWVRGCRKHGSAITHEELGWLARTAYAQAKRDWLAAASREGS
jgi:hypothetical protein